MSNRDLLILSVLVALGAFIWGRDISWLAEKDAAIPILAALPLFLWLGWPWKFRGDDGGIGSKKLGAAAAFFIPGVVLANTLLLALGWTLLLWAWLHSRLDPTRISTARKLLVLPVLAFPWIILEMQSVGWWFRLGGAAVTEQVFSGLGYDSIREGTNLVIASQLISVEAACSGMQTLQAMLIAGAVADFIILGHSRRFWPNLLLLIPLAMFANTLRIIMLSAATILYGRDFAQGAFHEWGGLAVLFIMFALCCALFQLQRNRRPIRNSSARSETLQPVSA